MIFIREVGGKADELSYDWQIAQLAKQGLTNATWLKGWWTGSPIWTI